MTQQTLQSQVELLSYANAVRARRRHELGIAIIAELFIAWAIIEVFVSTSVIAAG